MQIVEIIRRSKHGRTEPFICRGEDENLYFVKGRHAGYHSMVCEWIAGRLAQELALPIAPFQIVNVPKILVTQSLVPGAIELGPGEAFGSQEIKYASQFQWSQVGEVDSWLRACILVFDWWVANSDRILGEDDGNANLLWSSSSAALHLIDHNLAFSQSVVSSSWQDFCADHALGRFFDGSPNQRSHSSGPKEALAVAAETSFVTKKEQRDFDERCESLVNRVDKFWSELPEEWQERCQTLNVEAVKNILGRATGLL